MDSAVVRDGQSPGSWRFRSSMWGALAAYTEALARMPSAGMAVLFERVVTITYASGNDMRMGVALLPDSGHFIAVPSLGGDTIEMHPIEMQRVVAMKPGTMPESFSRAVRRGREELIAFTRRWVAQAPSSPDAWYHRANALELTGSFDAPDDINSASRALARAGALAPSEELRARLDAARVRVTIRRGAFDEATQLARSAIGGMDKMSARVAALRLPLAAFLLDVDATLRLLRIAITSEAGRARLPPWAAATVTPWLADSLRAFGVRATFGVCDGLASRRQALEAGFRRVTAAAEFPETRERLLHDVFRVAVPCLGPGVLNGFPRQRPLDDAAAALVAGDTAQARAILNGLERERRGMALSTVTEDAVLAESLLMLQTGDSVRARARLRASIDDVARMSPFTLEHIEQAAALARVRALVRSR